MSHRSAATATCSEDQSSLEISRGVITEPNGTDVRISDAQLGKSRCIAVSPPSSVTPSEQLNLVLISDTHGKHRSIAMPEGDVLIHAGDFTRFGKLADAIDFNEWLGTLSFEHIFVVLGNHEVNAPWVADVSSILTHAVLLIDSSATICCRSRRVQLWGCGFYWPVDTPFFVPPYASIPEGVDVLISHGPAASHVDNGHGCPLLLDQIERIRPKLVVCGHIHEAHGVCMGQKAGLQQVVFANAALDGGPSNKTGSRRPLGWPPIAISV